MNSSQMVDLDQVAAYWKARKLVDDIHLTHYVRWLSRFLAGPGGNPELSPADAQRVFVDELERYGSIPDWQVRQAARAIELYQKHYLRYRAELNGPPPDAAAGGEPLSAQAPTTLDDAIIQTQRLLRIRHYALRTEQTYLSWLSQYHSFVLKSGFPREIARSIHSRGRYVGITWRNRSSNGSCMRLSYAL